MLQLSHGVERRPKQVVADHCETKQGRGEGDGEGDVIKAARCKETRGACTARSWGRALLPPTMPPTTGPQCRPMRMTTGMLSGVRSVAQSFCMSRASRARQIAFS